MRHQWILLASVAETAVRPKRWIVSEDGHVAEDPRLLRSERETRPGRIRPSSLQERQREALVQVEEVERSFGESFPLHRVLMTSL
eukprot:Skav220882  [mRNA]  locus=scaffold2625:105431:108253:+ [translate_table: standard]